MKSKIGHHSLLIVIGGLVITEAGIHTGILQGQFWRILATGFEAGTIGALADWFAVSALFQKIPIPFVSRHTNIIVKNRPKLTEAIVELVTTQWLSSETIQEKLKGVTFSKSAFIMLEKPKNLNWTTDFVRKLLCRFLEKTEKSQVVFLLQKLSKDRLADLDIAAPLGTMLEKTVYEKGHHQFVDKLLAESAKALDDPSTRTLIQGKLKQALESYEKKDWIKKSAVWIGKRTGGIDLDLLTDQLLDMARMMATEAGSNPGHPIRQKLDQSLLELAQKLQEGDSATIGFIHKLQQKLMEDKHLRALFLGTLSRVKASFMEQLESNETVFMILLRKKSKSWLQELKGDLAIQHQLDQWVKETVTQFVNKYHHEVGNMVRSSLLKLDDRELVFQIQEKVGDDLQYIRLNGAVVGGLVGIIIALVRVLLL